MEDSDAGNVWDKATPDHEKAEPGTSLDTRRASPSSSSPPSSVDETASAARAQEEQPARDDGDTSPPTAVSEHVVEDADDDADAWGAASDDDGNKSQEFADAISTLDLSRGVSAPGSDKNGSDGGGGGGGGDQKDTSDEPPEAGPSTFKPPPAASVSASLLPPLSSSTSDPFTTSSQGQFDEFPDDDEGTLDYAVKGQEEPNWGSSSNDSNAQDDGFGDFGDAVAAAAPGGGGAGLDDDDDFGDFDEAGFDEVDPGASGFGEDAFPSNTTFPSAAPTSLPRMPYPDLTGCLPDLKAEDTAPIIKKYFETVFPDMYDGLAEPLPERYQDESVEDAVLARPGMRDFWKRMVEDPIEYTPFDWKRSSIRMHLAEAVGVSINQEELAQAAPVQSMKLPSIQTTPASPSKSGSRPDQTSQVASPTSVTSPTREASSSPRPAYLNGLGHPPVRPTTPSSSSILQRPIPPLNLSKCAQLTALREEDLSLKTLGELEMLQADLNEIAVETGVHLTALLERKELLSGQNDTYNAMIQDLVIAAQKMRSSSSPASGQSTSRKPSIRRTNSNSKMPANSASSGSTGTTSSKFWGGGASSKPNSRPASPAPPSNLKTSVGRSSAAIDSPTSAGAGREPNRRTSLW